MDSCAQHDLDAGVSMLYEIGPWERGFLRTLVAHTLIETTTEIAPTALAPTEENGASTPPSTRESSNSSFVSMSAMLLRRSKSSQRKVAPTAPSVADLIAARNNVSQWITAPNPTGFEASSAGIATARWVFSETWKRVLHELSSTYGTLPVIVSVDGWLHRVRLLRR